MRTKRPRGIVDQNRVAADRVEPGSDRIRAMPTAVNVCADLDPFEGRRGELVLSVSDHHPGRADGGMTSERLDRPTQHRPAAKQAVLLGNAAAHAGTASG